MALCWLSGPGCAGTAANRPTITFILGADRYDVNPYYANALRYYRQNPHANPGQLVTACRSLREVCQYLEQHVPPGKPWGTINLVAHGNAWTGMDLPVLPGDSSRTSAATLLAAQAAGQLPPLPDRVLDARTEIRLHGCALGLDTALLMTLSQTLGGADKTCPKVVSTRFFNQYELEGGCMQQGLAEFWYTSYPTYQRPTPEQLARSLGNKYPNNDLQWADALSRRRPRWAGDTYWRPVVVPVQWAVTYPDSAVRPALATPEAQQRWLEGQTDLQSALQRLGLPADKFRWSFRTETMAFEDGATEPAIVVEGQTTVCCVLRGVRNTEDDFYTSIQFTKYQSWTDSFVSLFCFCR